MFDNLSSQSRAAESKVHTRFFLTAHNSLLSAISPWRGRRRSDLSKWLSTQPVKQLQHQGGTSALFRPQGRVTWAPFRNRHHQGIQMSAILLSLLIWLSSQETFLTYFGQLELRGARGDMALRAVLDEEHVSLFSYGDHGRKVRKRWASGFPSVPGAQEKAFHMYLAANMHN